MLAKYSTTMIAGCLMLFSASVAYAGDATAGDASLTITFNGLHSNNGHLSMSLHPGKLSFDVDDETYIADLKIVDGSASVTFNGLPAGDYAVKSFHDENGDDELNTNIIGIPTEPYAFSNDAKGRFGPPTFQASKFSVVAGENTHIVKFN